MIRLGRWGVIALAVATVLGPVLSSSAGAFVAPADPTPSDRLSDPDRPGGPTMRCRLVGFAGVPGCEDWDTHWPGPEALGFGETKAALTPSEDVLVTAGLAVITFPFGRLAVHAQDTTDGQDLWKRPWVNIFSGRIEFVNDVAAGSDDAVFLAGGAFPAIGRTYEGFLVRMDPTSGQIDWIRSFQDQVTHIELTPDGSPVAVKTDVLNKTVVAELIRLNDSTGSTVWNRTIRDAFPTGLVALETHLAAPTTAGDVRIWNADSGDSSDRMSLEAPDGQPPVPVRIRAGPEGDRAAVLAFQDCGDDELENRLTLHLLEVTAEGERLAWQRQAARCHGGFAGDAPVFADGGERVVMVVGARELERLPHQPEYHLLARGFDADTGGAEWRTVHRHRGQHRLVPLSLDVGPGGERVYAGGTAFAPEAEERTRPPQPDPVRLLPAHPCASRHLLQEVPIAGPPVHALATQRTTCQAHFGRAAFATAIQAASGRVANTVLHEGPWMAKATELATDTDRDRVYLAGLERDGEARRGFLTLAYEGDVFDPVAS